MVLSMVEPLMEAVISILFELLINRIRLELAIYGRAPKRWERRRTPADKARIDPSHTLPAAALARGVGAEPSSLVTPHIYDTPPPKCLH